MIVLGTGLLKDYSEILSWQASIAIGADDYAGCGCDPNSALACWLTGACLDSLPDKRKKLSRAFQISAERTLSSTGHGVDGRTVLIVFTLNHCQCR
jgi:hypothetical protein